MPSRYSKEELKHKAKLRKINERGARYLMKQELKEEKAKYKKPRPKMETSKIMAISLMSIMLFLLFLIIGATLYASFVLQATYLLQYLITGVVAVEIGELAVFATYCAKAFLSKKEEEQVKLEKEKNGIELPKAVG